MITEVKIPQTSLNKIIKLSEDFNEFQNDLEDYLISKNTSILRCLQQARKEHKKNILKDWKILKAKYV